MLLLMENNGVFLACVLLGRVSALFIYTRHMLDKDLLYTGYPQERLLWLLVLCVLFLSET